MSERWSIIVHGGARRIPEHKQEANRQGCLAAVEAGQRVLEAGGSAVDAVVAAIKVLEDDPTFNAGVGAALNAAGQTEHDAAIMDGVGLDVGGVAAVRGIRHPIAAAHAMLYDQPVLLVGRGALAYATEKGVETCEEDFHLRSGEPEQVSDTVGCVALDTQGRIAAGTSTGGLSGVRPGRVGDSPIPGCGLYADNEVGGVSFSGDGESILRLTLATRLMDAMRWVGPSEAGQQVIGMIGRVGGEAGCIVLDLRGKPAFVHNSGHFAVAMASAGRPARAFLHQDEFNHG